MKKDIEEIREILSSLIVMITLNSNGKMIPRDSCDEMLKILKGKKWTKNYEQAIREYESITRS